jgi:hypothetical protein
VDGGPEFIDNMLCGFTGLTAVRLTRAWVREIDRRLAA